MPIRDLKAQIARLPEQPGVYVYYNGAGDTLYVGKARVLRDRVRSYLGAHGMSPRIDALLDEAQRLEVIVTDSVMEALALENHLIKQRAPRYNILLRDDKNYPYLQLTTGEAFPRVLVARRVQRDGHYYAGPFLPASLGTANDGVDAPVVRDSFVQRGDHRRARPRPCLEYDIKRCIAPCVREICSPEEYRAGGRAHAALSRRAERRARGDAARSHEGRVGRRAVRAGGAAAGRDPDDRHVRHPAAEDGQRRARRSRRVRPEGRARRRRRCRSSRCGTGASSSESSSSPTRLPTRQRDSRASREQRRAAGGGPAVLRGPRRRRPKCTCRSRSARPTRRSSRSGSRRGPSDASGSWFPSAGRSAACSNLAARNAELAYQQRFNENTAANYDALETLRVVLALPARSAPDRVLRHLDDPGQRDRRVDGRLRGRPDAARGVPEVSHSWRPGLGARDSGVRLEPVTRDHRNRAPSPELPRAPICEPRSERAARGPARITTSPRCTKSSSVATDACSRPADHFPT